MNLESQNHPSPLEEQLANASPTLPLGLKARTLARCADRSVGRNRSRGQERLLWAAIGVCAAQWLVVSLLDAQSAQLITATSAGQSANIAMAPPPNSWLETMRARSQMATTLMADSNDKLSAGESA